MSDYRLCYIDPLDRLAWFTTCPIDEQSGDDWDDAWYEHNAGIPYEWAARDNVERYRLLTIAWSGFFSVPCHRDEDYRYSVDRIKQGDTPWLVYDDETELYAGATLRTFCEFIDNNGGTVYLPATSDMITSWLDDIE